LELARQVDTVVFDKTGTLTQGKPVLAALVPDGAISEERLLQLAAAIQHNSEHTLARAVLDAAPLYASPFAAPAGGAGPVASAVSALPGRGMSAVVDGVELILGSSRLMQERGVDVAALAARARELEAGGHTISWLADA